MKFEGNDKIWEETGKFLRMIADEAFSQNNVVDDDAFYDLFEELREKVLATITETIEGFEVDEYVPLDKYGRLIRKGDKVVWIDPETNKHTTYEVYEEPTAEMVKLANAYGECEALPSECIAIPKEIADVVLDKWEKKKKGF